MSRIKSYYKSKEKRVSLFLKRYDIIDLSIYCDAVINYKNSNKKERIGMYSFDEVKIFDPEVAKAMDLELGRQKDHIELIASENFVSKAVMAAMGSPLTNKYAEGYPGKRYYGGCEFVDVVENLAIERVKELMTDNPRINFSLFLNLHVLFLATNVPLRRHL